MRVVKNNKSIEQNNSIFNQLIDPFLKFLKQEEEKNNKKITELLHVGKFLMLLDEDIQIKQLHERPDFILKNGIQDIGLEHQLLVDSDSKEREGLFENIFRKVESELRKENELPNFLANCYIHPYAKFKLNQKTKLISLTKEVIKRYIHKGILIENPIIDSISVMSHSEISISANLGAWWQKDITKDHILKAILKKEYLIEEYIENSCNTQWLLIVIGTLGESSYTWNKNITVEIKSEFNKIFVLEYFHNNLFVLK